MTPGSAASSKVVKALSLTSVKKLARAKPSAITAVFATLKPQFVKRSWLTNQNKYRKKVVMGIKASGARVSHHAALIKYIAASAPLHAADAARYLGRALLCLSVNDFHSARHFAYYAELRAAMSLLASAGIGVFDNSHMVVVSARQMEVVKGEKTHDFVWLAFAEWSKSKHAQEVLGSIVTAGGRSLDTYVSAAPTGYTIAPSVTGWLSSWGLDLSVLDEDKWRRNESTYRPSDLVPVETCAVAEIPQFLEAFWDVFDPSMGTRFELLDEQLVRFALEDVVGRKGSGLTQSEFDALFAKLGSPAGHKPRLEGVLCRRGRLHEDAELFRYARVLPVHDDPKLHFSMVARGSLLLRIAIGAVTRLMTLTGITFSDLSFWLDEYGARSGIWVAPPGDMLDLWLDINDSLANVRSGSPVPDLYTWSRVQARDIITLSELERIATWGLVS